VIFEKKALLQWFGEWVEDEPTAQRIGPGLYRILGIPRDADARAIKKAFRRMALQWHPDHCSEPNAAEQFRRINEAYQKLSDPTQRKRYDVALELTAESEDANPYRLNAVQDMWVPPLRCGYILCKGKMRLGRHVVEEIAQWEDITDGQSNVLVTSFDIDLNQVIEQWIDPNWRDYT